MESEKASSIIDLAGKLAARAEDFDDVLVLCRKKNGQGYSLDNGIDNLTMIFLCESFKTWLVLTHSGIMPAPPREDV